MKQVLFVCTGNTCRSSMAEGIFNSLAASDDKLNGRITASSAGISAFEGEGASENSITALKEIYDIDISAHRSRQLEENILLDADLILTMTREQKRNILYKFPKNSSKVFTLKEFTQSSENDKKSEEYNYMLDILDPYGMNLHIYKKCAEEIFDSVKKTILKLKETIFF